MVRCGFGVTTSAVSCQTHPESGFTSIPARRLLGVAGENQQFVLRVAEGGGVGIKKERGMKPVKALCLCTCAVGVAATAASAQGPVLFMAPDGASSITSILMCDPAAPTNGPSIIADCVTTPGATVDLGCTNVSCDALVGCVYTAKPATAFCDDGDVCTLTDMCSGGPLDGDLPGGGGASCVGSNVNRCDDFKNCTLDSCLHANGGDGCDNVDIPGLPCTPGPAGDAFCQSGGGATAECDPDTGTCVCLNNGEVYCWAAEDCCDVLPQDGVRDDVCTWCYCGFEGNCSLHPTVFASDMGGAFGTCKTDGFCDVHDRNHALSCFSGTNLCESINIDAGGAFGACPPDGFCNIHDANHALTCFSGTNACSCGPAPELSAEPIVVGRAALRVATDARSVAAGGLVTVRVMLDAEAVGRSRRVEPALQSYQLHLDVSGGRRGRLDLVDIAIEERDDFVFEGSAGVFDAYNVGNGQMLAGLDAGSVTAAAHTYLATFTYRVSPDAVGVFVVDVLHDESAGDQTFLIAPFAEKIAVSETKPAVITVIRSPSASLR